jgi:O-acetyl-ADP-ribose deacetylase (regulator of RNase III)
MPHTNIQIVPGDITQRQVDAIVNAANSTLLGGGGVDGAIHRAAGPGLLEECRRLGGCRTGEAKATGAHNIRQAKHIIHTVGPIYGKELGRESELLASCYRESLRLAAQLACRSIAFPSISTGAYGYPIEEASRIALRSIRAFLQADQHPLELVEMTTFSVRDQRIYERARAEII